ncbi:Flp1 family type IVb pilin [Salipaludibacillus daqingensis]|uniref:Flp1 family type IVb pilin n=1 Tax=Salipaludibacillus daqingensis TaxID=3041001 RepID=UPI0024741428|nr:Flp1 family type IVb pilin [Salipaludibacillus daqingensis]
MDTFVSWMKDFWNEEEGLQTLEIMLIIAVLVVIALMFRDQIMGWVQDLLDFGDDQIQDFQ